MSSAGLGNPVVLAAVMRQLRADGADLVTSMRSLAGWFAYRAARALRLPCVVTLQGELSMDASRVFERSAPMRHTLRMLLAQADRVPRALGDACGSRGAGRPSLGRRAEVIPNGVRLEDFHGLPARSTSATQPYIAALGRHVEQRALTCCWRRSQQHRRGVTSDGFQRPGGSSSAVMDQIEASLNSARDLGVAERALVPRSPRPRRCHSASRRCCPVRPPFTSRALRHREPRGHGGRRALIASDVGGVSEFVESGVNGELVPPDDPLALSEAISRLASDQEARDRLSEAGQRTAKRYDWADIERRYLVSYGEALLAAKGGSR